MAEARLPLAALVITMNLTVALEVDDDHDHGDDGDHNYDVDDDHDDHDDHEPCRCS